MCIRDRIWSEDREVRLERVRTAITEFDAATITTIHGFAQQVIGTLGSVSYTHLRAHETVLVLVCRLLLEKKIPN